MVGSRQQSNQKLQFLKFMQLIRDNNLPEPVAEYKFCNGRKWRFDYAWPEFMVAAEQEGGVWCGGRHTRGRGFIKDIEKYNKATMLGWRLFRYTPDLLLTKGIDDLKEIFKGDKIP